MLLEAVHNSIVLVDYSSVVDRVARNRIVVVDYNLVVG